jgi:hypothetical protein
MVASLAMGGARIARIGLSRADDVALVVGFVTSVEERIAQLVDGLPGFGEGRRRGFVKCCAGVGADQVMDLGFRAEVLLDPGGDAKDAPFADGLREDAEVLVQDGFGGLWGRFAEEAGEEGHEGFLRGRRWKGGESIGVRPDLDALSMGAIIAYERVIAAEMTDHLRFLGGNFRLVGTFEQDFFPHGKIAKLLQGEICLDAQVVPRAEIAKGVSGLADILANIDLPVGESDFVHNVGKFAHCLFQK